MGQRAIYDCDRCGRKGIPPEGRVLTDLAAAPHLDLCPGCAAAVLTDLCEKGGEAFAKGLAAGVAAHPKGDGRRRRDGDGPG